MLDSVNSILFGFEVLAVLVLAVLSYRGGPKHLDRFSGFVSGVSAGGGLSTGPRMRRLRRTRTRGTVGNPDHRHAALSYSILPKYIASGVSPPCSVWGRR